MSEITSSRQQTLDKIHAATQIVALNDEIREEAYASLPRAYVHKGTLTHQATIGLLIERLHEYDADVVECTRNSLVNAIEAQLTASNRSTFAAPPALPSDWLIPDFNWKVDNGLSAAEIEKTEGVVTAAFCAVADSGTIILHHSDTEGRRILTLLPDWHLCILHVSQIVQTLPEYFARCEQPPTLLTTISGPSATADIEMTRIKGVHGPRYLHVILVRDE